ncbi:MAG: hypothetical protein ACK5LT_00630 [Lachnospirales bacterium]
MEITCSELAIEALEGEMPKYILLNVCTLLAIVINAIVSINLSVKRLRVQSFILIFTNVFLLGSSLFLLFLTVVFYDSWVGLVGVTDKSVDFVTDMWTATAIILFGSIVAIIAIEIRRKLAR